ncbi:MAG TPA: hypothetical protein VEB20_15490 [Azospirillaceae bacterium]|nr:hypothetical protein [Azospirillaceae bacterium]
MTETPVRPDGVLAGPFRRPHNNSSHEEGTIHDDATAQRLGFRGGTIAGSIHMEQFPPLLVAAFGGDWYRTGGLSLYFRNPSVDFEPVRAFLRPTAGDRAEVWMESEAGVRILDGTASCGSPDPDSLVRRKLRELRPAADIRMLASVRPGRSVDGVPTRIPQADIDRRLAVLTEPDPRFTDASILGRTTAPLSATVHALRAVEPGLVGTTEGEFVGLFGAIELLFHDGPVFADTEYLARGRVVALAETPKTEMLWYEAVLADPATGRDVVSTLHMSRLLKATSPLWS